jgi:hypothetical protein
MTKTKKVETPISKLKKWVKKKISCGSWQASYEEFLAKIQEVEKSNG